MNHNVLHCLFPFILTGVSKYVCWSYTAKSKMFLDSLFNTAWMDIFSLVKATPHSAQLSLTQLGF